MHLEGMCQVVQLQELHAQPQSTGSPEHAVQVSMQLEQVQQEVRVEDHVHRPQEIAFGTEAIQVRGQGLPQEVSDEFATLQTYPE